MGFFAFDLCKALLPIVFSISHDIPVVQTHQSPISIFTIGKHLGHSPGVFSPLKCLLILDFTAPILLCISQVN